MLFKVYKVPKGLVAQRAEKYVESWPDWESKLYVWTASHHEVLDLYDAYVAGMVNVDHEFIFEDDIISVIHS